jgi:Ca-activated chloride channel homolog
VPERKCLSFKVVRSLILSALIELSAVSAAALVTTHLPLQQVRDEREFTIAIDADLVIFNVTVTDSKDRHVAGLRASDFQVREENHLQDIKLFTAEDGPASIGLIIDNSGSMREKHTDVTRAALAFATMSNSEDEMFVVTFNEKVYFGLPASIPFTSDVEQIHSALVRTPPNGMTALYDALAAGIEHLRTGSRDQKALVVLSDGGDNASHRRLIDVLQIAQRSTATIYTIGIYDDTDMDRNPRVLRKIAETTGGQAYFPASLGDMERVWRDIARGIRSQYVIGYRSSNPAHDGKFRKVTIIAKSGNGRDLRVTSRDGYLVPEEKGITKQ